jgi:Arm DNA-binding domain
MARGPNQLTSNQVRNAKPGPDGKAVLLCDGANLWLHVGRAKDGRITKSWIFRYAMPGTRRERHMRLGPLHTVGLAAAREMAADARLLIRQGRPPRSKGRSAGHRWGADLPQVLDVRSGRDRVPVGQ